MAMLGVLLVNVMVFTVDAGEGQPKTSMDHVLAFVRETAFNGKCYPILAAIFGYSLGLQMRLTGAIPQRRQALTRRLIALSAIGLLHGLILYRLDILVAYGILGFVAYGVRKWSTRSLLIASAVLTTAGSWALMSELDTSGLARYGAPEAVGFYRNGSLPQLVNLHVHNLLFNLTGEAIRQWPIALAMILLGVLAERHDFFSMLETSQFLHRFTHLCSSISVVIIVVASTSWADTVGIWLPALATAAVVPFGIGIISLISCHMNPVSSIARWFSYAGRMSLTVYLTQSLVCTTILYGYGFGFARFFTPTVQAGFTVLFFAAQVVACRKWLESHDRGPVEMLVRHLAGSPSTTKHSSKGPGLPISD
jgi:uncharacterized protein